MGHGKLGNPFPNFDISEWDDWSATDEKKWKKYWTVDHDNIDPIQVAADFYILQAVSAGFLAENKTPPFKDFSEQEIIDAANVLGLTASQVKTRVTLGLQRVKDFYDPLYDIEKQAVSYLDELTDRYLDDFRCYLEMTCGGELRHHNGFTKTVTSGHRRAAWAGWWYIREKFGLEALNTAIKYFNDFGGGGYGGPKWATNPQLLLDFYEGKLGKDEKSNRRMFMDRVFTLVHNNGCMLNKLSWANYRKNDLDAKFAWPADESLESGMQVVLNAHSGDTPDMETLVCFASAPVSDLYSEYVGAMGDK